MRPRWAALDGLRGLACLAVILANVHHAMGLPVAGHVGRFDLATFAESGIGVAMLLVLSGALLAVPCWQALDAGGPMPSWARFAWRRAVRIIPPYYACVAAFAVVSVTARDARDLAVHLLFVNNLWERSFYSISLQFWTIGMFVQCYLVLPLVFGVLRRSGLRGRAAAGLAVWLAVVAYGLHAALMATRDRWFGWPLSIVTSPDGYVLSHSTLAHLPLFLLGIAAGYVLSRTEPDTGSRQGGLLGDLAAVACLAGAVAVASVPAAEQLAAPYGRYLFPWLPLLLVGAVLATLNGGWVRGVVSFPPLRGLGVISYGVYVYQMACLIAVSRLMGITPGDPLRVKIAFIAVGFVVTVVVAVASYVVMERPLRRWLDRRTVRSARLG